MSAKPTGRQSADNGNDNGKVDTTDKRTADNRRDRIDNNGN